MSSALPWGAENGGRVTARGNFLRSGTIPGNLPAILIVLFLSGCGAMPPQTDRRDEPAFNDPETTTLGQRALIEAQRHGGQSGLLILDRGYHAFLQRAALIEAAERSIDAQYYIWNGDRSGRYLAHRLMLAADRGVRVRLLLDDFNVGDRDAMLAVLDRHKNIEIRIFNPSAARTGVGKLLAFTTEFRRLNRRMHNKTFVADAAMGIVGGRNIGDEYFDLHPEVNFLDRDVLAQGPVVQAMGSNFDAYWNSAWTYPIRLLAPDRDGDQATTERFEAARAAAADPTGFPQAPVQDAIAAHATLQEEMERAVWATAELVFDPPAQEMAADTDQPQRTARTLQRIVEQTDVELLIESAYLILGDSQLHLLEQLRARGVGVDAVTNSLASNDLTANHAGYARRRSAMLAAGLNLYELRPDAAACVDWIAATDYCDKGAVSLHAKSAVFDRETLYIGSFNVNLRSIYLNGETVLVIHSRELAQRVAQDIAATMAPANSWHLHEDGAGDLIWSSSGGETWTQEPDTGLWRRFKSTLIGLLPIEKYL